MNILFSTSIILVSIFLTRVESHGYLADPPARNVMWRNGFSVPASYSYTGLNCGGTGTQHGQNGGKCGICGDGYSSSRPHEVGGPFATGTIGKTYNMGSEIDVHVQITANHKGYFEFRICPVTDENVEVTQECLDSNMLIINGNGYKRELSSNEFKTTMKVKLPDGMSCEHCVLQWHYRAGNSWGTDPDGTSGIGKGAQEEYHNCADIRIVNAEPVTATVEPVTASVLPVTASVLPVTASVLPVTASVLPVTASVLPVTASVLPVTATVEPVTASVLPVTATVEPVTASVLPVTATVEPVTAPVIPVSTDQCFRGNGYYAKVETGCQSYFRCIYVGTVWERVFDYTCPPGLLFDSTIVTCNWSHLVKCKA